MTPVVATTSPRDLLSRQTTLYVYVALLFVALALDASVYVGSLFHVYTHDVAALAAGILGVLRARGDRSLLPNRLVWAPLALLMFLLANTLLIGALQYSNVPADMTKLFWFEHGNALRIVGELLVWVWTLGHLAPTREDATMLLDIALWGATASVAFVEAFWLVTGSSHVGTTTFDLNVMVGLPMAIMFVMARGRREDLVRLAIFGAASLLLYSRTSIIVAVFTSLMMLVVVRRPRAVRDSLACVIVGWLLVFGVSTLSSAIATTLRNGASPTPIPAGLAASASPTALASPSTAPAFAFGQPALDYTVSQPKNPGGGQPAIERTTSFVSTELAPYTIPSRLAIWSDAIRIFEISPIVGVGYHNYFLHSRVTEIKDASRFDIPGLFSSLIKQAHSDFLSWLAETGVVGFALYLGFWGLVLMHGWRRWRAEPWALERNTFTLAFMVGLLGVSTFGEILVPRTPDWTSSAILWWIVIGLLFIDRAPREELERRAKH